MAATMESIYVVARDEILEYPPLSSFLSSNTTLEHFVPHLLQPTLQSPSVPYFQR